MTKSDRLRKRIGTWMFVAWIALCVFEVVAAFVNQGNGWDALGDNAIQVVFLIFLYKNFDFFLQLPRTTDEPAVEDAAADNAESSDLTKV